MTVTVQEARRVVDNTGNLSSINVNFHLENEGDLAVYADDTRLSLGAHYTVTGVGNDAGFTVNILQPNLWVDAERYALVVRYPINQPSDVDNGGQFGARFERALDRLARSDQTLKDGVRLAIKMPYTTPLDVEVFMEKPVPGALIQWDSTGTKLINYIGGVGPGPGPGPDPQPLSEWAAYYADPRAIKSLNLNTSLSQAPNAGIRWPTTAESEAINAYTGGNPGRTLPRYAGTDLAKCVMLVPSEDMTNFVASSTPWINHAGTNRRIIPLDIRTVLFNQMESPALFEPVQVNGFGMLSFRYIGDNPIHTVIEGTIQALIQCSEMAEDSNVRYVLRITPEPSTVPFLERGQNDGKQNLAMGRGSLGMPQRFRNLQGFNDPGSPLTPAIIANMVENTPELYNGSQQGFFSLRDMDTTEALRQSDDLGPVGPEVQTTNWIDLRGINNKAIRCLAINFTGTSTRGRIQFKRADGSIYVSTAGSWDVDGRRVYPMEADADYARIYYSGRGTTQSNISIRALGPNVSSVSDPLKGFWQEYTFAVCRDVTFWPGGVYALEFLTEVINGGGGANDYSFRYQGGGLSFLFDAGAIRKRLMRRLYKES